MKIGIATFFESTNYGTVLQAYALQKYLLNLGYEAELIQIRRDLKGSKQQNKEYVRRYSLIEKVIIKLNSIFTKKSEIQKSEAFKKFRFNNLIISEDIFIGDNVEIFNRYDVLLSGGDQIWNPYHKTFSMSYFFSNAASSIPRISYGSSFGVKDIKEQQTLEDIKRELSRYYAVSVRETSGVALLKEIGINAVAVLDPVFLLNQTQWLTMMEGLKKPKKKYCLVYSLIDFSMEDQKRIKDYAKKNHLQIRIMPSNRRNMNNAFKKDFLASPEEFLSLIYYAERVFTNSFHGTAFSILFNKQFTLLNPSFDGAQKRSVRMSDFLSLLNLDIDKCKEIQEINYLEVNQKLHVLINNSRGFLSDVLFEVKKGEKQ